MRDKDELDGILVVALEQALPPLAFGPVPAFGEHSQQLRREFAA